MVDVVAATPPRTADDALRLAVEQTAIAPESGSSTVRELAAELHSERRGAYTTPRHWVFDWPD
jgi:hypothetical protein